MGPSSMRGGVRARSGRGAARRLRAAALAASAWAAATAVAALRAMPHAHAHAHSTTTDDPPSVQTPCGTVYGSWDTLADGTRVATFLGIRYALPPTGDARWTPPVPAGCWPGGGGFNATAFGSQCVQPDGSGSEDCLFLNVWVPEAALARLQPGTAATTATVDAGRPLPVRFPVAAPCSPRKHCKRDVCTQRRMSNELVHHTHAPPVSFCPPFRQTIAYIHGGSLMTDSGALNMSAFAAHASDGNAATAGLVVVTLNYRCAMPCCLPLGFGRPC
jgi:hypothetical protein